jgi:phosphate transport system protein
MSLHLEQELENAKLMIFKMSDLVIDSINNSIEALKKLDSVLAQKVIKNDSKIDQLEKEIDEELAKILVTRQPAAIDLRLALSLLKMNTDLERMGDMATNIAKETIRIKSKTLMKPLVDIPRMAQIAINMLMSSLQSITDMDAKKAREVIQADIEIDELNRQIYRELFSYMAESPHTISEALSLIWVAKALERIGDHAANIAEKAIFYIEGVDVRHMGKDE